LGKLLQEIRLRGIEVFSKKIISKEGKGKTISFKKEEMMGKQKKLIDSFKEELDVMQPETEYIQTITFIEIVIVDKKGKGKIARAIETRTKPQEKKETKIFRIH
jgi:hypothetical protein